MFSAGGCFLIRMEERREDTTPVSFIFVIIAIIIEFFEDKYAACLRFRDELINILSAWHHPIDTIIIGHGYLYPTDPPLIVTNPFKDQHFNELQSLYGNLSRLARDLVLVPQVQFETGMNPHMLVK